MDQGAASELQRQLRHLVDLHQKYRALRRPVRLRLLLRRLRLGRQHSEGSADQSWGPPENVF